MTTLRVRPTRRRTNHRARAVPSPASTPDGSLDGSTRTTSRQAVDACLRGIVAGLRIAMFCIGAADLAALKGTPLLVPAPAGAG